MRPAMKLLLALILVTFLGVNCAAIGIGSKKATDSNKATASKKATDRPKKGGFLPSAISANLLPNLAVGVNSCYVFLKPNESSDFFGPLTKGESVKRIDTSKYWILVWIPRLRISGWVRKNQVYAANIPSSNEDTVPTDQLIILNIAKSRVNIRKAPTTRSRIIFRVKQRQEYVMLDEKKGWYQIWLPQIRKKGWIFGGMVVKQRRR